MRRVFRILMRLALLVSLLVAISGSAFATNENITLFPQVGDVFSQSASKGVAVIGDTLYIAHSDGLYAYQIGDTQPRLLIPQDSFNGDFLLFSYNGELMVVDCVTAEVKRLDGDELVSSDVKLLPPEEPLDEEIWLANYFTTLFEHGGKIYSLVRFDSMDWSVPRELWMIDPATGAHQVLKTELDIISICGYLPGKLLALAEAEDAPDVDLSSAEFVVLDAETGKIVGEPIKVSRLGGWNGPLAIYYDATSGATFYSEQNKLLRVGALDAKPEIMGYYDRELFESSGQATLFAGKYLVTPTASGIYIRNISEGPVSGGTLKIANFHSTQATTEFMMMNPEVPIEFVEMNELYSGDAGQIATAIGSGDSAVDIIYVNDMQLTKMLIENGHAMDLSGSELLKKAYDRMYPVIKDAMMVSGKPMAFPASVAIDLWMYNELELKALGLEYPETFAEYIDLMIRWEEELSVDNPSIILVEDFSTPAEKKAKVFYEALSKHISEMAKPNEPLRFSSPELRDILLKIEQMPGEFVAEDAHPQSFITRGDEVVLMVPYLNLANYNQESGQMKIAYPPAIIKDASQTAEAFPTCYLINPNAPNKDLAVRYLEFLTEHEDPLIKILLYPDYNEPIPERWVQEMLKQSEAELAELASMEVAENEKRDHEEIVKALQNRVDGYKKVQWHVSAEAIESYRAFAKNMVIKEYLNAFGSPAAQKEIQNLINRYMHGQLDLDQMLSGLEQKAMMIYQEQK